MDRTKANVTEKIEIKTDWSERNNENADIASGNVEQDIVIEGLEKALIHENVEVGSGNEEQNTVMEKLEKVLTNENVEIVSSIEEQDIVAEKLEKGLSNVNVDIASGNEEEDIVIEKMEKVLINENVEIVSGNEEQDIIAEKLDKMNVDIASDNEEQDIVVERLEKVLNFLKGEQIKNNKALVHIKNPLDDLESSFKFLLIGTFLTDILSTEIKEDIVSYLCDSRALTAAEIKANCTEKVNVNMDIGSVNEVQDFVIEKVKKVPINENEEVRPVTEEQDIVIDKLEKVLNVLKSVKIKEALIQIKKPLDDLEFSLKYLPIGPFFNDIFPTEIKGVILSYLCDSSAFIAAAVCQEWLAILKSRYKGENSKKVKVEVKPKEVTLKIYHNNEEKKVSIAQDCSKCENSECLNPEETMKAAAMHKLNVHMVISQPVTEVDPKVITEGLTAVSNFTLSSNCVGWISGGKENPIMSIEQIEHLFEAIEKGEKIMEEVILVNFDLNCLNQERLASCLINKIKKLTLDEGHYGIGILDASMFISKLLQDSANLKLSHLTLRNFDTTLTLQDLNSQVGHALGNALCNVENVRLCGQIKVNESTLRLLMENILNKNTRIKTLIIDLNTRFRFNYVLKPQDLKTVFRKMKTLRLENFYFSLEQLEAVRSLPDVEVIEKQLLRGAIVYSIRKGSSEMF